MDVWREVGTYGRRGHLRQVLGMRRAKESKGGVVSGALMYQERRMCFRSWVGMEGVTMRVEFAETESFVGSEELRDGRAGEF